MTSRPSGDSRQEGEPIGPPLRETWWSSFRLGERELTELSKAMSQLLRYTCQSEGLIADADGWVQLEGVIGVLSPFNGVPITRDNIIFVVGISWTKEFPGSPRFEVRGDFPYEEIRATSKNDQVRWQARNPDRVLGRRRDIGAPVTQRCHCRGTHNPEVQVADRGASSSGEAPLPDSPPAPAPPQGAASDTEAVQWVEIRGGQGGVRALQHVASGQICRGAPPADGSNGWVELFAEREVELQEQGGQLYYWHVATGEVRWERPQPGAAQRATLYGRRPDDCLICWVNPRTTALFPCGHHCLCCQCAAELVARADACPVCRGRTQHPHMTRIFFP